MNFTTKVLPPFFLKVALQAVERFEIDIKQRHLDTISISVEGEYKCSEKEGAREESEGLSRIRLCRGYSREHRPDLKQFLISLVCSADGGVPLWLKLASGNEHDSQQFARVMKGFAQQWTSEGADIPQVDEMFSICASHLKA
jgi:transposase